MATIITVGDHTMTPTQVLGYASSRQSRNIVHDILGRESPDITLRPASLRTGTLEMGFTSEADAKDAEDRHAVGGVFAIISTERASVEMSYVTAGAIGRELEDSTRDAWVVRVDYQETTDAAGVDPIIVIDGGTPEDEGEGFLDGGAP
jgi:hypothetical protein